MEKNKEATLPILYLPPHLTGSTFSVKDKKILSFERRSLSEMYFRAEKQRGGHIRVFTFFNVGNSWR